MQFLFLSIPASFWSFMESISDSRSGIGSGISSEIEIGSGIDLGPKSESDSKRSRFWHLHKNRPSGQIILHIDSHKESKFTKTINSPGDSRTDFASETSYLNSRTDSHSGANYLSGVNLYSVTGADCDSQVDSGANFDSGIDSDPGIDSEADFRVWFAIWNRLRSQLRNLLRIQLWKMADGAITTPMKNRSV